MRLGSHPMHLKIPLLRHRSQQIHQFCQLQRIRLVSQHGINLPVLLDKLAQQLPRLALRQRNLRTLRRRPLCSLQVASDSLLLCRTVRQRVSILLPLLQAIERRYLPPETRKGNSRLGKVSPLPISITSRAPEERTGLGRRSASLTDRRLLQRRQS